MRLRIDRFAITANNITYAVFGDMLGYWDFFPTGDDTFGRVPAMGWATVVESRADDISLGRRFYGWYPMSSHVVFTPTATKDGFRDDGAHRQAHAPVYRAYVATDADPMYPEVDHGTHGLADGEDRHALLRGLFLTGFLAEEFFADGGGSGDGVLRCRSGDRAVGVVEDGDRLRAASAPPRRHRGRRRHVAGQRRDGREPGVLRPGRHLRRDRHGADRRRCRLDRHGRQPASLAAVHEHFGDGSRTR